MRYGVFLVLALIILSATAARAVTVIDVTTATTLFHDGFESGNFSSPSVGTWTLVGPDVTVTNAASPGPAEGSYYAQAFRNSNTSGQGNLRGTLASTPATADLIRLQMMVYLPSAGDANARGQFILTNGDFNTARAWVRPDGAGNVDAVGPGLVATDTGLNYVTDSWQLWELDYVIGSSTFSVSIDNNSASGFTSYTSGVVNLIDLFNGNTTAGSFFLDAVPQAVPEPGTWAIAVLAVLTIAHLHCRRFRPQRE